MSGEDLHEAVRHLPDQVRDIAVAASDVDGLPSVDGIENVVLLGVGGARVAADVVEAICELGSSLPILASGGRCPTWVSPSTLAVAISQSGDDEATLAAAEAAFDAGARIMAVTAGGELRERCSRWGGAVIPVDPAAGPAAGLGVTIVPVLVSLERLGFVTGMSKIVTSAASQISGRIDQIFGDADIDSLAEDLIGRVAIVSGAGAIGKHAARRWVQELDRVGEIASVRRRVPTGPRDVATGLRLDQASRNGAVLIVLRHSYEPDGLDGGVALAQDAFPRLYEFGAEGDGPLAQLLDLVLIGDAVVAAVLARTDPWN